MSIFAITAKITGKTIKREIDKGNCQIGKNPQIWPNLAKSSEKSVKFAKICRIRSTGHLKSTLAALNYSLHRGTLRPNLALASLAAGGAERCDNISDITSRSFRDAVNNLSTKTSEAIDIFWGL